MAYRTPKTMLNALLAALRAWDSWPEPPVFRKGPQQALTLGEQENVAILVALDQMVGGEQAAGSHNRWWHEWQIRLDIMVKDILDQADYAEDLRLDTLEEFLHFVHDNRDLGTAQVWYISSMECGLGAFAEGQQQVFRWVTVRLQYKTLRG